MKEEQKDGTQDDEQRRKEGLTEEKKTAVCDDEGRKKIRAQKEAKKETLCKKDSRLDIMHLGDRGSK